MYTKRQELEIKKGICAGVDTDIYAKEYFDPQQMGIIREGLEENLDVKHYAKPELSYEQMYEIYEGLIHRIDVTVYNHEFNSDYLTAEHMKFIRLLLEKELDPKYLLDPDLTIFQVKEIYKGLLDRIDVSIYAHSWVPDELMNEIRLNLVNGNDVDVIPTYVDRYSDSPNEQLKPYIDKGVFNLEQIQQLRLGLEYGIDVDVYAKPELNWHHMCMIRLGMTAGFDMRRYANSDYDWRQVEQILIGLEDQLDVSKYDIPNFYWADMKILRIKLGRAKYVGPYSA